MGKALMAPHPSTWLMCRSLPRLAALWGLAAFIYLLVGVSMPVLAKPTASDIAMPLADSVRTVWEGGAIPQQISSQLDQLDVDAVTVVARAAGKLVRRRTATGEPTSTLLRHLVQQIQVEIPQKNHQRVDTIEVTLAYDIGKTGVDGRKFSNIHRGILGLRLAYQDNIEWYGPGYQIMTNRSADKIRAQFAKTVGQPLAVIESALTQTTFRAHHFLVRLDQAGPAILLDRGNQLVPLSEVSRAAIQRYAERSIHWLSANVGADGRMTYAYYPSTGKQPRRDNAIRQWMATLALIRSADFLGSPELLSLAAKNMAFNIQKYYRSDGPFGMIYARKRAKLGSAALAALSMRELAHATPAHENKSNGDRARRIAALDQLIDHLWQDDGSFRTFHIPADRNDNQNFYPGEALYYWAHIFQKTRSKALLGRFMKSVDYYMAWHMGPEKNPAFVPWHTQAYYLVWKKTKNPQLKHFIFQMNDWLIEIQQAPNDVPYKDLVGRFYASHGNYGPPHASSTGVYLEGLVDALALAREIGDTGRAKTYEKAIQWGFRSLIQLQFDGDDDAFYISGTKRSFVDGGLRTTVYDNRIRVDNVQHGLLAALKYLALEP